MQKFIKRLLITKNVTFSKAKLALNIFPLILLTAIGTSKIEAATCSASTSATFISCLSSIAGSGDTIKLTATFTLTGTVNVPNKNFTLAPNGFDIITANAIFSTTGNPTWTVISSPNALIVKQSVQSPKNNFDYLTSTGSLSAFLNFVQSGAVLAIDFQSFEAKLTQQGVQLTWLVLQNDDMEFVVERSSNAKEFVAIGSVDGLNYSNANTPSSYTFTDLKPSEANAYYRIKSIDWAGKIIYSKTLTVANNKKTGNVKIYPNPIGTEGQLTIEADSDIQNIVIANALGQVVMTSKLSILNVNQLSAGLYHIFIKTNDTTVTKKFIK